MKKIILLCACLLPAVLIFTGCARNNGSAVPDGEAAGYETLPAQPETREQEVSEKEPEKGTEKETLYDKIPMVMINGKLYYDTGKESTIEARCGTMDGEITSAVDGSETPSQENQSNFGTGFGYQFTADDTIEIFMNDKWIVFQSGE